MNVGSLFSGIGGIELGFEWEGFKTIWFIEKEPYCQAVLKKHWPWTPIYGDITTVDFSKLERPAILTGGFPCQDISNAGKRKGITGERSSLWKYYAEAIRVLRPRYAVIENVSALTTRGLSVVLADLAQIGYDAEWLDLRASDFGAPHKRERIFIVCYPHNNGQPATQERGGIIEGGNDSKAGEEQACESTGPSKQYADVAYSLFLRLQRKRQAKQTGEPEVRLCGPGPTTWVTEPNVGRVAHGVPNRVDRIKAIGNAVVPQCAQYIAQIIKRKSNP